MIRTSRVYAVVAKLYNRRNLLKYDGGHYHQYVTELTYLRFLSKGRRMVTPALIFVGVTFFGGLRLTGQENHKRRIEMP